MTKGAGKYEDVAGFCKSATQDEIRTHGHVLTPGRYVGAEEVEDDGEPIEDKMKRLTATLEEQFVESAKLEQAIRKNLVSLAEHNKFRKSMSNENRWIQRLQNLNKAFKRLHDACDQDEYNELEVRDWFRPMSSRLNFAGRL